MKRLDARSLVFSATCVAIALTFFQGRCLAQDVIWLPQDGVWKYYQDGEPELDFDFYEWHEPEYNDSSWASGPAELGFDTAGNSETTLLTRGEITYYFRTTIMVTAGQLSLANQLVLNLVRDDGAVIYINGAEVHRDNMGGNPGSEVAHTALATQAVAGSAESEVFTSSHLSNAFLTVGENTIAVEVHQSSAGSSDISFSLGMEGYNFIPILGDYTPPAPIEFENSSAGNLWYSTILKQDAGVPFELGWDLTTSGSATSIHFVHPQLEIPESGFTEGHSLVVSRGSATLVTDVAGTGHRDEDVPGAYRVDISNYKDVSVQFGLRGFDSVGAGMGTNSRAQAWIETSVTGDSESFNSEHVLDITGGESTGLLDTLVAHTSSRKVLVPTSNIGTTWRNASFNDASWTTGTQGAGYERSGSNTYDPYLGSTLDLESQLYNKNETLYMRVPFTVANKDSYTILLLCMRYDDGFVAYLNGQEVESRNAPGSLTYNSGATSTNDDARAVVWESFDISDHLDLLVNGQNVLAIHGLNKGTGSSDMLIDPELKGIKPGGGGGGNPGEPEFLDDIAGDIDGPFTIFSYDVPDSAQTVRLKFQLNCNTNDNAVILDKILISGTPLTVQTYADWISLNTDFDPDDEGHPTADPDGDTVANLLEYAFGGSATEPNAGMTPTSSIIEIEGESYIAITWRQLNASYSGGLGQSQGGFTVRDISYIPQFSFDGSSWEDNAPGARVATLFKDGIIGGEIEGEGEYVDVTAFYINSITTAPSTKRLFTRLKVTLEEQ